jgi:hypothetical protein
MKQQIIVMLLKALMTMATEERLKNIADKILDLAENEVLKTANKYDDAIVLPLCAMLRNAFNIKD